MPALKLVFLLYTFPFSLSSGQTGKEGQNMKGYNTSDGYMGYVDGEYQLFASEADYREWMED